MSVYTIIIIIILHNSEVNNHKSAVDIIAEQIHDKLLKMPVKLLKNKPTSKRRGNWLNFYPDSEEFGKPRKWTMLRHPTLELFCMPFIVEAGKNSQKM